MGSECEEAGGQKRKNVCVCAGRNQQVVGGMEGEHSGGRVMILE